MLSGSGNNLEISNSGYTVYSTKQGKMGYENHTIDGYYAGVAEDGLCLADEDASLSSNWSSLGYAMLAETSLQ